MIWAQLLIMRYINPQMAVDYYAIPAEWEKTAGGLIMV
jgi:hypothetical protein